jgi:hypothetical protein
MFDSMMPSSYACPATDLFSAADLTHAQSTGVCGRHVRPQVGLACVTYASTGAGTQHLGAAAQRRLRIGSFMGADLDKWIEQLKGCAPIAEPDVKVLCHMALDVLVEESNVQHVNAPVTICALPCGLGMPLRVQMACASIKRHDA